MSLSTQLTRGTLALPMLALFGALSLVAGQATEAQAAPETVRVVQATATTTRIELTQSTDKLLIVRVGDAGNCGIHARPQLMLAQAPADLGPIAQRQGGCRA